MITKLSHATLYVTDQDQALDFYTKKLGFEVRTDVTMEGFRWLTVGPRGQRDLEIVLMKLAAGGPWDDATLAQLQSLLAKGGLGGGVFEADDCHRTYEELRVRGVEFTSPPTNRPYGIEATFKDPFGNWFSMTQPRQ
jgi:catechol 2,3-dioxygenase-like lactoylglutathione lyase family enzyme